MEIECPSISDLTEARKVFLENETRNLFYRLARELVDRSFEGSSSYSLSESLAVLLQTWNSAFYRFRKFDSQHFTDIDLLLAKYGIQIHALRKKTILDLDKNDNVEIIYRDFEELLGPVGAAKALHLLCPKFFPIWDREIAICYGFRLKRAGKNSKYYYAFMEICREQILNLQSKGYFADDVLKRLDEYNYCKFTREWS